MLTDTHSKVFNPVSKYCVQTNTHKQKHDNKVRNTSHTLAQILSCFHLPSAFPSILLILSISLSLTHTLCCFIALHYSLFLFLTHTPHTHTYTHTHSQRERHWKQHTH